ncbi:oxidoreductase [Alicyclobacillus contaminans]|uniref:SDR family NAD(P)-dependent oxidoreductase n=1 Tax=Alicyclobacillus contaminans TaxID=392016 RepID=UPI0004162FA4|nr:SDR family NAD(P)-dependent oxidoreductase [Alicyclobacillus contaminans]GMA49630.1 oxidoreductase [Alicyclobacillus contaminans]
MAIRGDGKVAVVTGASSGIGAATAVALADAGFRLALGARRVEKLEDLADRIAERTGEQPWISALDVTSPTSTQAFVDGALAAFGHVHVLVNNAGLARGTAHVAEASDADEADWREMVETNVLGLLRVTRLLLPHLLATDGAHIINVGSIAGREAYAGGSVYCGTKFAVRAITEALRQELLGKPVRVTTVDPGMVETEFSIVRYHGDTAKASDVYAGMTPLTAEDIADCICFAATRPQHVNIDAIIVKPLDQAGAGKVARRS